jgi:flagellar protein FlbD
MIRVTRLGGRPIYINSDLIESLETTPDTSILLTNGHRLIVKESPDEVIRLVVEFRRNIFRTFGSGADDSAPSAPTSVVSPIRADA